MKFTYRSMVCSDGKCSIVEGETDVIAAIGAPTPDQDAEGNPILLVPIRTDEDSETVVLFVNGAEVVVSTPKGVGMLPLDAFPGAIYNVTVAGSTTRAPITQRVIIVEG